MHAEPMKFSNPEKIVVAPGRPRLSQRGLAGQLPVILDRTAGSSQSRSLVTSRSGVIGFCT